MPASEPDDAAARPLVSIGIPAYNRPATLARAVRSALGQDYPALEVIVSDDASPDGSLATAVREAAAGDERLRYVRQPVNLGHAGNYQWVLEQARGEYFMWLCDDDWLDPGYVRRCRDELAADPALVLAGGLALYYRDRAPIGPERAIELGSPSAVRRVLRYFMRVNMNGSLFSLARRADLLAVGFPDEAGGDWLLIAALAGRGQFRCLNDVHIHRSATGLGSDVDGLAQSFGATGARLRHHHVFVAARVWRAVRSGGRILPGAGAFTRVATASLCAAAILVRFTAADLVRAVLGPRRAGRLETLVSRALRARDARREARD